MRSAVLLLKMLRAVLVGVALGLAVHLLLTATLTREGQLPGASGAEQVAPRPAVTLRS